jgi:hypothetical protein
MRTAWRPLVLISCEMLWVLGRATPAAAATARGGVHARHALYRELYLGGGNGRRRPGVGAGQWWPGAGVWRSFGLLSDVEERGRGGAWTSSPTSWNGARAELRRRLRCAGTRSAAASPT